MALSDLVVRVPYQGDGSTTTFAFAHPFASASDLAVWVEDSTDPTNIVISKKIMGTDYSVSGTQTNGIFLSGANVIFVSARTTTQALTIIRDPSPVQNLTLMENGYIPSLSLMNQLDYITEVLQRHKDQLSRAILLPDGFTETFNATLPSNLSGAAGSAIFINATADGLAVSASGGGANISAFVSTGPFSVTNGQSATSLSNETIDSAIYSGSSYWFEIIRGSIYAKGWFDLQFISGNWRVVLGESIGDNHGVTWSVTGTTVAQLQAALTSGPGNGTIKLKKLLWAA